MGLLIFTKLTDNEIDVIPAQAGIQLLSIKATWVPARSAHSGLQARIVTQAACVQAETPASPFAGTTIHLSFD